MNRHGDSFWEMYSLLKALLVGLAVVVFAIDPASGSEKKQSQSPVQDEMVALDSAFKATIDAIILNEPEKIGPAFGEVNAMREQVERALKGGRKFTLPKHQKRFKEFVKLDNKFHHELEILLKAAKKKKMGAVRRQTHRLLDLCVRCHAVFRK